MYLSACLSVCLSVCLSACLPVCLSDCLSVGRSAYLSIMLCPSIYLSIHLSIYFKQTKINPTLSKLGRNDSGPNRPTYQGRNDPPLKIGRNDPGRHDPEPSGSTKGSTTASVKHHTKTTKQCNETKMTQW